MTTDSGRGQGSRQRLAAASPPLDWSGGATFVLFLMAHLLLDLAILGIGAAAYEPPAGGCRTFDCVRDGGEWFAWMAVIVLVPGVLAGALVSVGVHRLLYGSVRLPRKAWAAVRVAVLSAVGVAVLLVLVEAIGER